MPELPEVETVVRTLRPQVLECCIERVEVLRERSLHPLSLPVERLAGTRISAARRRGKLALLDLEPPAVAAALPVPSILAVHLRMTGRFMVHPEGAAPLKHTRIIFHLQRPDGSRAQLFFDDVRSFGLVFAATPELLERWDFWRSLGPEPLHMGPGSLGPRLHGRRAIKAALLDQTVLAGIGNIYADESLFRAGIDPRRPAGELSEAEAERLRCALQEVLRESIAQCGSSIRDYRDANGNVSRIPFSSMAVADSFAAAAARSWKKGASPAGPRYFVRSARSSGRSFGEGSFAVKLFPSLRKPRSGGHFGSSA